MDKDAPTDQQTVRFKTYPKNEQVTKYYTEVIKLNTKRPHLVHDMTLNYEYICIDSGLMQSKNLPRPLEKLKLIKALYLNFYGADIENDMILQNISQNVRSLSSLRILKLQFPCVHWISLKGVEHLASALTQMKILKRLLMKFTFAWVNDETLYLFFKSLKKSKNLRSFQLDISLCENITEKTFKYLAWTLKHLQQPLKELCLGCAGLNLREGNALHFLASGLANLINLQTLRINFSQLRISSTDNFSFLLSSLRHLKSLRVLILNFLFLPVNASVLKHLASSFESLIHLHTLSLSFGSSPTFAVQEMEVLAQCLQSTASSLKNLTLDFSCSHSMNDKALEKLSAGLKALTKLSEINLQCNNCPNIGDIGVESVVYELWDLPNLHSVNLYFRFCRPIKDAYEDGLRMKKNIKNLTFHYVHLEV